MPATPGRKIFQTGAWVLADRTPLPKELQAFLDGGDAPVLVGFGSMPAAAGASRPLIGATRAVGRRVLLSTGWAGLELIDDAADCFALGDVSHEMLLPKVAAFVHHGGAGTTAAVARAGIPQVIAPLFGDQFLWSSRVTQLGLGATVPFFAMTEESLAGALRHALDPAVKARARSFAGQVGTDGARIAAHRLEAEYGSP